MFDRNSDYALNKKDPYAIVCKSATGIHIRLTRADFSSAEEFEKWKRWSDENYHAIEKADHRHSIRPTMPTSFPMCRDRCRTALSPSVRST